MSTTLDLRGLDGSNPLAYLAAIGVLRVAAKMWPDAEVRLKWSAASGPWHPSLKVPADLAPAGFAETLAEKLRAVGTEESLPAGDNLTISPLAYRAYAAAAAAEPDRRGADFASAFGCDSQRREEKDEILDTAFRTMAGAGHQHFLGSMRDIIRATKAAHLEKALFAPWRYDDPIAKLSLRFDPRDDQRYALRWDNPSGDGTRTKVGSMLGANRLAIEGLPLFPTIPVGRTLRTTGFSERRGEGAWWSWPIWKPAVNVDVCRSLLALRTLTEPKPDRAQLHVYGVAELFRSRRVTIGKIRSFTPAQPA